MSEIKDLSQLREGSHIVKIDNTSIPVVGRLKMLVQLGNWSAEHDFLVTTLDLSGPVLGFDFLSKYEMDVQCRRNESMLVWGKNALPLSTPPFDEEPCYVALAEDVTMKRDEITVVRARVVNKAGKPVRGKGVRLLEPNAKFVENRGVMPARVLVDTEKGTVPVQLVGLYAQDFTLRKHTRLGELACVAEVVCSVSGEGAPESSNSPAPSDETLEEFMSQFKWEGSVLSDDEKKRLAVLLWDFRDNFLTGAGDVGETDHVTHEIPTGDATPIKQMPRRVPQALRPVVETQVNEMLANGIIRVSTSPWASPIVLVRKKDGTYRFCVDYRKVNAVTVKDSFPLPRIDNTLDILSGARFFATIDFASGYWQVKVKVTDRMKTAFATTRGLYEFNVMPFGLTNAPATFQRLMAKVLSGLTYEQCLVYMDDVIVFSADFESHLKHLRAVFERIADAGLKMKPSKCSFGQERVDYLGHVVSSEGVRVQSQKVAAVQRFPEPKTLTELRSFLSLAGYYRRFIPHFSGIASPLTNLLKKGQEFLWTTECQSSFAALKEKLTNAPVLAYPRADSPFILATDASGTALGAVLSQLNDDGDEYSSSELSARTKSDWILQKTMLKNVLSLTSGSLLVKQNNQIKGSYWK